jgi:predicted Zn-dependent peptidase
MKMGGIFGFRLTPTQGKSPGELEPALQAEIDKVLKDGVTDEELQRFKKATLVGLYSRLETNTGIRETLASTSPARWRTQGQPSRIQAGTRDDVRGSPTAPGGDGRNVLTSRK